MRGAPLTGGSSLALGPSEANDPRLWIVLAWLPATRLLLRSIRVPELLHLLFQLAHPPNKLR